MRLLPSMSSILFLAFGLSLTALCVGTTGCAGSRNEALQERQNWMNDRTSQRAERRQIRSDNMDARSDALFDAM